MEMTNIIKYLLSYNLHVHVKERGLHVSINNKDLKLKGIISLDKTITLKLKLPDKMFNQLMGFIFSQAKNFAFNSKPI